MSLLTLSAPSGAGKTTAACNLIPLGVTPLISVTTRAPRPSDLTGEYEYVTDAAFAEYQTRGDFLWNVEVHGNRYGTRKRDIDEALASAQWYVAILTLDVLVQLHEYARHRRANRRIKSFYLWIEDERELRRRLVYRGDAPEDIERRIGECRSWNNRDLAIDLQRIDATKKPAEVAKKIRKMLIDM